MSISPPASSGTSALRPEILRFERGDGAVEYYDPILERFHLFGAEERNRPEILASALLLETPETQELRRRWYWARRRAEPRPAPSETMVDPQVFKQAAEIPGVAEAWLQPEAWRRLAEERRAGRTLLILRSFLDPVLSATLRDAAPRWAWQRMDTPIVHGSRAEPPVLRALLLSPAFRAVLGATLGVDLPPRIHLNAWMLEEGDSFAVHPDGPRYRATFALGLNDPWTADDGGAIAFGDPGPEGLQVRERWLPFLGDACFFVPSATSWHCVEVAHRRRLTVSGWWLAEEDQ